MSRQQLLLQQWQLKEQQQASKQKIDALKAELADKDQQIGQLKVERNFLWERSGP